MRGLGACLAGLTLLLAACTPPALPPASPAPTVTPPVVVSATPATGTAATPSPAGEPAAASPTSCAGRTWPPYPLGEIEGITAVSTDRQTIEITNRTDRTYHYRVAGWQLDQFETCLALGDYEVERGPIAPGATERVMVGANWWRMGVPVTVGLWDERCGEGCNREPTGAIDIELAPNVPLAS
jgi:hypothetical protein